MLQTALQPTVTLFAAGMIGLGVLALTYGDFALVWQPVAPWVPGRLALAYVSGVLMLFVGVGLLFRATAAWAVRVLFPYLVVWALLKVPALVVAPQIEGVWLGFGELAMLVAGGWVLFACWSEVREDSWLGFAVGDRGIRMAKYLFALWVIPVGLSHFFYTKATIDLIPQWMPGNVLGVPDRGGAYRIGVGRVVFRGTAGGSPRRGGDAQRDYAAGVGAGGSGASGGAHAMDRLLHFMDNRVRGVGAGRRE
jgi:uncharacterized membrane protein